MLTGLAGVGKGKNIVAIVLAAGLSKRFGTKNKLVEKLGGVSILEKTIINLLNSPIEKIIVVTGHQERLVQEVLGKYKVKIVKNSNFAFGMGSSISSGIKFLDEEIEAALIVLGDMPFINPLTIIHLLSFCPQEVNKKVFVPVHKGKNGNPVLWTKDFFPELLKLSGDQGGKSLIKKFPDVVYKVNVSDPGILMDIDLKSDLTIC